MLLMFFADEEIQRAEDGWWGCIHGSWDTRLGPPAKRFLVAGVGDVTRGPTPEEEWHAGEAIGEREWQHGLVRC